jgi:hypothetical protein
MLVEVLKLQNILKTNRVNQLHTQTDETMFILLVDVSKSLISTNQMKVNEGEKIMLVVDVPNSQIFSEQMTDLIKEESVGRASYFGTIAQI